MTPMNWSTYLKLLCLLQGSLRLQVSLWERGPTP
jgi:hypothetical protein